MKGGEVTLNVFADFSLSYEIALKKLYRLRFLKSFLTWTINYLTERWQFVQIYDKVSNNVDLKFGVPQGSVLRLVLFNFYVSDLCDHLDLVKCHPYADDTSCYENGTPINANACERRPQYALDELSL